MNLVSPKKAVSLKEASRFWLQLGLVSFGGAYAVLPYAAQGAVEQFGWLNASQMLDGLALGETTPGPLIMVVAFVGFMGCWNRGLGNGLADGIGDAGAVCRWGTTSGGQPR
jgi:chromate transporter